MKNNLVNPILDVDSYKTSHYLQYPINTINEYAYIAARNNKGDIKSDRILFFGLSYIIQKYLSTKITKDDVNYAESIITKHGLLFNKKGWMKVVDNYDGLIPIKILSVPEGSLIPFRMPLVTVESTDEELFWLATYVETILLRVWYPSTVATLSWSIKQLIKSFMKKTSDNLDGLQFKLHDFGSRGVSSQESAGIGGLSHLLNFSGTDTIVALEYANNFYENKDELYMPGFSIPASQHSSMCAWGKNKEKEAFSNMIDKFKDNKIFACVSDGYNIYNAVDNIWGKELKEKILNSGATLVIRPDSGDPVEVVSYILKSLYKNFGGTINTKGYTVINPVVRVIYGDGINYNSINKILSAMEKEKYSTDNIVFGMGGALLQQINRDTFSFAYKSSAVKINNEWISVAKNPITDTEKSQLTGKVTTNYNSYEKRYYVSSNENNSIMKIRYICKLSDEGKLEHFIDKDNFEEIRDRINKETEKLEA